MPRPAGRPEAQPPGRAVRRGVGNAEAAGLERVQRTLARAGYGSRRKAEELVREGRVRIGPRLAELGDRVDPLRDRITVDGVAVPTHPELRYYAFNKPPGVTTTMADRHAERSLASYLPPGPRVFPVGRLDRGSEGLLLLTNDGGLAHRLQHPRYGVEKEYLVEVRGSLSAKAVRWLTTGVDLEDGVARALRAGPIQRVRGRSAVTVVMGEGRKREVRRMMDVVGFPVVRLVRIRVGSVRLGELPPGSSRALLPEEIADLYARTGLGQAVPSP